MAEIQTNAPSTDDPKNYLLRNSDGSINKQAIQFALNHPEVLHAFEEGFKSVICRENSKDFSAFISGAMFGTAHKLTPEEAKSVEEAIDSVRKDPETIKTHTDFMNALGKPSTCDIPMSALSTPKTIAGISKRPGKTVG